MFIHLKRLYLHPRHADKLGVHANAFSSAATVKISAYKRVKMTSSQINLGSLGFWRPGSHWTSSMEKFYDLGSEVTQTLRTVNQPLVPQLRLSSLHLNNKKSITYREQRAVGCGGKLSDGGAEWKRHLLRRRRRR